MANKMQFHIIQVLMLIFVIKMTNQLPSKQIKRAPLEMGYISFTNIPTHDHPHPSVFLNFNNTLVLMKNVNVSPPPPISPQRIRNVWVSGHVDHHSYIPGHHVLVPIHAVLVSRNVHTLLVRPLGAKGNIAIYEDDPFKTSYGGYGVGTGYGGQGAGHGAGHAYQLDF